MPLRQSCRPDVLRALLSTTRSSTTIWSWAHGSSISPRCRFSKRGSPGSETAYTGPWRRRDDAGSYHQGVRVTNLKTSDGLRLAVAGKDGWRRIDGGGL